MPFLFACMSLNRFRIWFVCLFYFAVAIIIFPGFFFFFLSFLHGGRNESIMNQFHEEMRKLDVKY